MYGRSRPPFWVWRSHTGRPNNRSGPLGQVPFHVIDCSSIKLPSRRNCLDLQNDRHCRFRTVVGSFDGRCRRPLAARHLRRRQGHRCMRSVRRRICAPAWNEYMHSCQWLCLVTGRSVERIGPVAKRQSRTRTVRFAYRYGVGRTCRASPYPRHGRGPSVTAGSLPASHSEISNSS